MKTFRVGVIGAGAVAQGSHIPGYAAAKNCKLVALCDPLPKSLDEVRKRGWIFERTYSDYRQMLQKEDLDAVSICTPNVYHSEMAIAALKKGCAVCLEKPIAISMPEGLAIQRAVKKYKGRLMVCFSHRFNELNIKTRQAVQAGKIGKPYMIRVRFAHKGPIPGWAKTDWFYRPEMAGGGAVLDMAIHAFDLAQFHVGPVMAVQAKVATLRKKIKVDDNVVALLEFGDTALGYVEAGWTSPAGFGGVEIMGDNGVIVIDYALGTSTLTRGGIRPDYTYCLEQSVLAKVDGHSAWINQMAHFTSNLGKKGPFCVGIEEGVSALRIVLGTYESSRTGKRVKIT